MLRKSASGPHKEIFERPPYGTTIFISKKYHPLGLDNLARHPTRAKGKKFAAHDKGVTPLRVQGLFVHLCPGVTPSSVPQCFMRRSATLSTIVGIQKRFR